MEYSSKLTKHFLSTTSLQHRRENGQYFTNDKIKEMLFSYIEKDLGLTKDIRILEPSCGTGEFLSFLIKKGINPKNIFAIEKDEIIFNLLKEEKEYSNINLFNEDFTLLNIKNKFDLIIGNPPYFELSKEKKESLSREYDLIINGRVNIFSLFMKKSIELLKPNGILAFVISTSMNNGSYYRKLRDFILSHTCLEHLITLNNKDFEGTQQPTQILILKRKSDQIIKSNYQYIFERGNNLIFTQYYKELEQLFQNKFSIKELGFKVLTGNIVWNQKRNQLTNEENDNTIKLLWSHNINENNTLNFHNNSNKPSFYCYLVNDKVFNPPAIILNRITGSNSNAQLKCCLINDNFPFVAENHVNVIIPINPKISIESLFEQIKKHSYVVKYITGNTQISKSEIEDLIPIDKN